MKALGLAHPEAMPALGALWAVPGPAIFLPIIATAVVFYVPFSLHVTLSQDYLPSRIGTGSGVPSARRSASAGLPPPSSV